MLYKKYRTMPDEVKASGWNVLCSALQKVIAFITIPVFTRIMNAQEFGEYSLYMSWYSIISILGSLNLFYSTTYNGLTKYANDKKRIISSFQSLTLVLSALLFLVSLVFRNCWNNVTGLPKYYLPLACISIALYSSYNYWVARERYEYKYKAVVVISLLISIATPLLAIVAMRNTILKAQARVVSYALVQVIVGSGFFAYNAIIAGKIVDFKYWKYALFLNIPLLPHYLSSVILSEADRIIIGNICDKDSVALYSLAYNIGMVMTVVVTAINNSFTPFFYRQLKIGQGKKIKKIATIIGIMVVSMCVLLMTVGPEVVLLMGSKQYKSAIWVVPPITCSVYFCFLYPMFSTIELYYEKTFFVSASSILAAVTNVLLNYIFIPIYGYYAAAYTTLFCYIIYSFAHFCFSMFILKKKRITEKYLDGLGLFAIGGICLIIMFIVIISYHSVLFRIALLVIEIIVVSVVAMRVLHEIGELKNEYENET